MSFFVGREMNSVALQVLEQFNSAFIQFLNPATPQDQRNAIGFLYDLT